MSAVMSLSMVSLNCGRVCEASGGKNQSQSRSGVSPKKKQSNKAQPRVRRHGGGHKPNKNKTLSPSKLSRKNK